MQAIEVSGIPLAVVDLFHPKQHEPWATYAAEHRWLEAVNASARGLFVLAYFVVRVAAFPYFAFAGVLPDIRELYSMASPPVPGAALLTIAVSTVALTALQLYWALLIARQVRKLIFSKQKGA